MLEALSRDPEVLVRAAVAGNHSTPEKVRAALSRDSAEAVRVAASEFHPLVAVVPNDGAAQWTAVLGPYGRVVEEVAWSVVRGGFDGSLEELVGVAVGAVAE